MRILHLLKEMTVILIVLLVLRMNSMDKKLKTGWRCENLEPSASLLFILLPVQILWSFTPWIDMPKKKLANVL